MSASLSRGCSYSPAESIDYSDLHLSIRRGSFEHVKYLIDNGADIDAGPDPALHLALRRKDSAIAHLLLEAGANFSLKDSHGDCPIHIACALGLLDVVHSLCSLGCSVEVPTAKGLYPLHLAAKHGHINIVRCLCASGCNTEVKNADGIKADITALKYGHNDIADLLDRLRVHGHRDSYARQLVPTSKTAFKISLRLLGHCGVGKSTLAKSLGAGLFSSLFRRSSSLQSNKSRPSSPVNSHIEMDFTPRQNSLTFEASGNYQSTKGVHVHNMDVSGVGDVLVWDFSGHESYFPAYHHFLKSSPYALTAVLFSLEEPPSVQIQQVAFWINFLVARQAADLPTREYGKIILIATHVDTTRATKTQQGEWISTDAQKTLETVIRKFPHVPKLLPCVVVTDCNVPASFAFKQLKSILSGLKHDCEQQSIGTWTGLLDHSLSWLSHLQKEYEQFPVLTRSTFADLLHSHVNPLALDNHIAKLLRQLQLMGEIFRVEHLVVLSVPWLCSNILGDLLSLQFILKARITGVYTAEDFQASYTECDALCALELLEALDLCVQCDTGEDVEYEFPVYNQTEMIEGLWEADDPRYAIRDSNYGGVRLYTSAGINHMLTALFPHVQTELRKMVLAECNATDTEMDLYQWFHGSKLCCNDLESLITLEEDLNNNQYVELKVRGPRHSSRFCFYFMHKIMRCLDKAVLRVCPGLLTEKHILSSFQLRVHAPSPYCYESHLISSAMLDAESTSDVILYNPEIDRMETIMQLILFDDQELSGCIIWGCALKIHDVPPPVALKLCGILDPPDNHGRDWCLLALKLGFSQESIAVLDSQHASHTMRLLTSADCTIGVLITSLHELDRLDAAEVVLRSAPLFKVIEHVE